MWMRQTRSPRSGSVQKRYAFLSQTRLVFRPSAYVGRVMRIDPVRRQSVISLGSTLALTAIGFLSTMFFAHTVGPAILGAYFLFVAYYSVFNLDRGTGGSGVPRSNGSARVWTRTHTSPRLYSSG